MFSQIALAQANGLTLSNSLSDSPYPYLEYYEQANSSPDLVMDEAALTALPWKSVGNNVPNFGFSNSTYWFRFSIHNNDSHDLKRLLEISYPLLDRVDLLHYQDGKLLQQLAMGNRISFRSRPINHRHLIFPLTFSGHSSSTLFLKVKSGSGAQLPMTLWKTEAFWLNDQRILAWQFLYYGLMCAMIFYNLFLVWGIRDTTYLYYALTMAGVLIFQAILHGSAYQFLWPDFTEWNSRSLAFFIPIANAFSSVFSNKMLRINETAPAFYTLILLQVMAAPVLSILSLLLPYHYVVPISTLMVIITASIIAFLGVRDWKHHQLDARIFSVAWNLFVLGCLAMGLNKFGLLPYNWITENLMQVGSALETILLSLALAVRINRLREDRLQLQHTQFQAREKEVQAEKKFLAAQYESKAKSEFLANMSHEIRTPMNGVLGVIDVLKDTALNSRQSQLVGTIESSGKLLLNIINDILDLSKVESGKLELEHVPLDIYHIVRDALFIYNATASQKGLLLASYVDTRINTKLIGDPTRFKQVIYNLVGNALKFTEQGHVFIHAQVLSSSTQAQSIRIEVIDSGIGLDQQQQRKLFESFTQADTSTSRKFGGTGLGLAISKKLIEAMDGEIGVDSTVGESSVFWIEITLPIAEGNPSPTMEAPKHDVELYTDYPALSGFLSRCVSSHPVSVRVFDLATDAASLITSEDSNVMRLMYAHNPVNMANIQTMMFNNGHLHNLTLLTPITQRQTVIEQCSFNIEEAPFDLNHVLTSRNIGQDDSATAAPTQDHPLPYLISKKVLVAEDNLVNQMVIRELLKPLVGNIDIATNGKEAVECYMNAETPYDYIFMDCEMPEMDGYEATQHIRKYETLNNQRQRVRIIALTAHAFEEFKEKALLAGMDIHLSKPINRTTLLRFFESEQEPQPNISSHRRL